MQVQGAATASVQTSSSGGAAKPNVFTTNAPRFERSTATAEVVPKPADPSLFVTGDCVRRLYGNSSVFPTPYGAMGQFGTTLVAGSAPTKTLHIWDLESGKLTKEIQGHETPVECLAIAYDGTRVITGSRDNCIRIIDAIKGTLIAKIDNKGERPRCICVQDDNVYVGGESIHVYNRYSGECVGTIPPKVNAQGSKETVIEIQFSRYDMMVAYANGYIQSYFRYTYVQNSTLNINTYEGGLSCMQLTKSGQVITGHSGTIDNRGMVFFTDFNGNARKAFLNARCITADCQVKGGLKTATLVDDTLVVAYGNGVIHMMDPVTGVIRRHVKVDDFEERDPCIHVVDSSTILCGIRGGQVARLVFSPKNGQDDLKQIKVGASAGVGLPAVQVLIAGSGAAVAAAAIPKPVDPAQFLKAPVTLASLVPLRNEETVFSVLGYADGKVLATQRHYYKSNNENDTLLWVMDAKSGDVLHKLQGHTKFITCAVVVDEGKAVITGSQDGTVRVWDLDSGTTKASLEGHGPINCLQVSGDQLFVGDHQITVWNWKTFAFVSRSTEEFLQTWYSSLDPIDSLSVTPDLIIAGYNLGMVRTFDRNNLRWLRATPTGHFGTEFVTTIGAHTVSAHSNRFTEISQPSALRIQDPAKPDAEPRYVAVSQAMDMKAVQLLADGNLLIAFGTGEISLWDPLKDKKLHQVMLPLKEKHSIGTVVMVSPDRFVVTHGFIHHNDISVVHIGEGSIKRLDESRVKLLSSAAAPKAASAAAPASALIRVAIPKMGPPVGEVAPVASLPLVVAAATTSLTIPAANAAADKIVPIISKPTPAPATATAPSAPVRAVPVPTTAAAPSAPVRAVPAPAVANVAASEPNTSTSIFSVRNFAIGGLALVVALLWARRANSK